MMKTKIKRGQVWYRYNDLVHAYPVIIVKVKKIEVEVLHADEQRNIYKSTLEEYYRLSDEVYDFPVYKCINPLPRRQVWERKLRRIGSSVMRAVTNVDRQMLVDFIQTALLFAFLVMTITGGLYMIYTHVLPWLSTWKK